MARYEENVVEGKDKEEEGRDDADPAMREEWADVESGRWRVGSAETAVQRHH